MMGVRFSGHSRRSRGHFYTPSFLPVPISQTDASVVEEDEDVSPYPAYFLCDLRHDASVGLPAGALAAGEGLVSKWRQKERLKTTAVALVVCLNIGVDPPDVVRVSPCARTECWIDPLSMPAAKALDAIGKSLQVQYERWQPRAKYKMHLDPTTEDVKRLAVSCRKNARVRSCWERRGGCVLLLC